MKKITLITLLMSLISLSSWGQCTANYSVTMIQNGSIASITNNSSMTTTFSFGDGDYYTAGATESFLHTYTANGNYSICAKVIDSSQNPVCNQMYCGSVTVTGISSPASCQASYQWFQAYDSTAGTWINQVYLVATTSGSNLSYAWTFGDGGTSSSQYPTHAYNNVGAYGVCLTITTGDSSCTQTFCDTVEVFSKAAGFTLNVVQQGAATGINETVPTLNVENVYPNPTVGNATLNINATEYSAITINILDITGKVVMQQNNNLTVGNNSIEMNTQSLTNGMYIISIQSENGNISNLRLVKK